MSKRLHPDIRKAEIITAAIKLAQMVGYDNVTRSEIANAAGVANGLVSRYWGTMPQLKRAIMRQAIQKEDLIILVQGLARADINALKAPKHLKEAAIRELMATAVSV